MSTTTQQRHVITQGITGWPEGTEVDVRATSDGAFLICDNPAGGWEIAGYHLDSHDVLTAADLGRRAWYVSEQRLQEITRPLAPRPTQRRVLTLAYSGWPAGTVFDVRAGRGEDNVYMVADAQGGWRVTDHHVGEFLTPADVGRYAWATTMSRVEEISRPEGAPTLYVVPGHLATSTGPADGFHSSWANKRVFVTPAQGGRLLRSAYCEDPTATSGGAPRMTEDQRRQWGLPDDWPLQGGWNCTQELIDRLVAAQPIEAQEAPTAQPVETPTTYPVGADVATEGGLGEHGLPTDWIGGQVWVDPTPHADVRRVYLVGGTGRSSGVRMGAVTVRDNNLPQEWMDKPCWHVTPDVAERIVAQPQMQSAPEQPTAEQSTAERLRAELAQARAEHEEKMRRIAQAAAEWGERNGYGEQVRDFLDSEGFDFTPVSREFTGEVLVRISFTGTLAEGHDLDEVTSDWLASSFSVEEDYDGSKRLLVEVDDDWDDVSLDTSVEGVSVELA